MEIINYNLSEKQKRILLELLNDDEDKQLLKQGKIKSSILELLTQEITDLQNLNDELLEKFKPLMFRKEQ